MSSVASRARGSAKACCQVGRFSSDPVQAPMKVGSRTGGRKGYMRQKPTDSRNERASSRVRTGRPPSHHCWRRKWETCQSVIVVCPRGSGPGKVRQWLIIYSSVSPRSCAEREPALPPGFVTEYFGDAEFPAIYKS